MGKGERERERLREERLAAEKEAGKSDRNRLLIGYAVVSTVVLAIAVGVFLLVSGGDDGGGGSGTGSSDAFINTNQQVGNTNGVEPDERAGILPPAPKETDLEKAAAKAGCELRLELKDEGHTHLPRGSEGPDYKTEPANSGDHVEAPFQQADGAYSESPSQVDVVHALEHGRLAIQYSSDLPEKDQLELKGLFETIYGATLLFPNDEMPYDVAAVTWTNILGCTEYKGAATLDAIRAFGKETWGKYGGEPVSIFKFTGPTPADPDEG